MYPRIPAIRGPHFWNHSPGTLQPLATLHMQVRQEIPRILWECIHKRAPPLPVPKQINPGHATPSHLLKTNFNIIIFPSTPTSSKWSFCLRSPHQNATFLSLIRATCPSHLILLYFSCSCSSCSCSCSSCSSS